MDPATIFVLFITAFAVGILAFLELKSRRNKRGDHDENPDNAVSKREPTKNAASREQ